MTLKAGSLFSGIGGLDLGLDRAGIETVFQVENDPTCQTVLARHWPVVRRLGDIAAVATADLAGVDLVHGGFPCQDVSVAGRRKGLAGERSGLWFEFHRVLEAARPRWCVIENVPGLLTSNSGRDFGTILRGLAELGYGVAWRVLDAQYFGLAQRRLRVFVVGSLGDFTSVEVLLESDGLPGNPPPRQEARQAIASGVVSRALSRVGGGDDPGANKGATLTVNTLNSGGAQGGFRTEPGEHLVVDTPPVAAPLRSRSATGSNRPGRGGEDDENLVTYWDGGDLADTLDASQIQKRQMMPERRRFPVVFEARIARNDRGRPEEIAPPLKAESGRTGKGDSAPLVAEIVGPIAPKAGPRSHDAGNFHSNQGVDAGHVLPQAGAVRRLTPLECERLQGFPDGWTEGHSDSARYRMLGNAVAVPVAEWVARRIRRFS